MSRKKKYVIIAAVVVGLLAIVVLSRTLRKKEGEPVQADKVKLRRELQSKVSASGEIRPVKFYNLTAEVPGRVEEIYVKESDTVKKGDRLVRVDPTQSQYAVQAAEKAVEIAQADVSNQQVAVQQTENKVDQTQADLSAAEAELERMKADLEYAKSEFDRYQSLVESGVANKSQFEQAKSRFRQAEQVVKAQQARINQLKVQLRNAELDKKRVHQALESAQARVAQAQAQWKQEQDRLNKTIRYSPIDGVVSSLPVKVGEYALAGFTTTPLLTVADMSEINAEIKVDETDIANVAVGNKAKVKVDALGDQEIEGDVVERGASAITRTGQTTATQQANTQEAKDFLVKIRLNPTPEVRELLKPGMSATAVIVTATTENVLTVPLQAIVPREVPDDKAPTGKKEVQGVFVMGSDSRVSFKPITTGIKGDQDIEVKSGLSEGEEIVIGPYKTLRALKDGDQVKREEVAAGAATKS
ncbi:MAG TPA: efflux RND transporter periplasmic adaptor subunit [Blastocatellia bacterium]|nr:efflux RND transporter periplasmic adaptor subunit [Blastocatellia bacterium]